MCEYRCAQPSYTIQHRIVLIIFPLILQIIFAHMTSTGWEGSDRLRKEKHLSAVAETNRATVCVSANML